MSADTPAGATDFAHLLLKVSDIEKSQRFYVDLLGFTVRPNGERPRQAGRPERRRPTQAWTGQVPSMTFGVKSRADQTP